MKASKRLFAALLASLLTLSLAACNKDSGGKVDIPSTQTASSDFQKNMHQSTIRDFRYFCETEDGIYAQDTYGVWVYYIEKSTKKITILCAKPECEHSDNTCNAYFVTQSIWFYDGVLYFNNSDYVEENGTYVNRGNRIYSVKPDGTERRAVQDLEFTPGGNTSGKTVRPIFHRGVTYFPYSGVLYALPLGGDINEAVKIWGDEIVDNGTHFGNLNELGYTLWADGDIIYFMVNLPQSNGTYKDTLFAYDTNTKEVSQIWQTPDGETVGLWETAGVSVSQWYILNGTIYFYLSGNDFWKTDLTTGETVKLAATHEKTTYGSAIFSDDYLCLINDEPENSNSIETYGSTLNHTGGDTIYVYGLDGTFIEELSLKSLYDEFEALKHCALAFCSGDDIYFIADASTKKWTDGSAQTQWNQILCCINIESGEITQIYNWD